MGLEEKAETALVGSSDASLVTASFGFGGFMMLGLLGLIGMSNRLSRPGFRRKVKIKKE